MKTEANGVETITGESLMETGRIALSLPQGDTVDFTIREELKDGHSLVVWRYRGYRTRQGKH